MIRISKVELELLEQYWERVMMRCVLQPAVNLELLEITGSGLRSGDALCFDGLQAQLATFPRLATLSLRNIIWENDTSGKGDMVPLDFIVRHQKTLKKLELHNCAINVDPKAPTHYWADIYKRLANAMTGLVDLKVEIKLNEVKVPYVYYSKDSHTDTKYLKKDDLKDGDLGRDALALEEFMAIIKSRGMGGDSEF